MSEDQPKSEATGNGGERRLRRQLAILSDHVVRGTGEVALESERWFLGGLRVVDRGLQLTVAGASLAGRQMGRGFGHLRMTHFPPKTPRQRLREAIEREAKRMRAPEDGPAFRTFSDNVAALVELVLSGTIALEDVGFAFEGATPDETSGDEAHENIADDIHGARLAGT